jgi:nitrite reductase/ring-hydroxylating ferredoxin subunit
MLCPSAELTPMQPRILDEGRLIALRLPDGALVGYRNACPHMGIELDWEAQRLLSRDGKWLRCTGHGALFRPEDGLCVSGPCKGENLRRVALRETEGLVMLHE